jgi:hypothetical protein
MRQWSFTLVQVLNMRSLPPLTGSHNNIWTTTLGVHEMSRTGVPANACW